MSDHLPECIMRDEGVLRRYRRIGEAMSEQITGYSVAGVIEADPNNEFVWVKFVDCQAAVAAAKVESYADGRVDGMRDVADLCYQRGVKAAREAVAALTQQHFMFMPTFVFRTDALAAIDALLKEKP